MQTTKTFLLSDLPNETLVKVASHLSPPALAKLFQCSKRCKAVAQSAIVNQAKEYGIKDISLKALATQWGWKTSLLRGAPSLTISETSKGEVFFIQNRLQRAWIKLTRVETPIQNSPLYEGEFVKSFMPSKDGSAAILNTVLRSFLYRDNTLFFRQERRNYSAREVITNDQHVAISAWKNNLPHIVIEDKKNGKTLGAIPLKEKSGRHIEWMDTDRLICIDPFASGVDTISLAQSKILSTWKCDRYMISATGRDANTMALGSETGHIELFESGRWQKPVKSLKTLNCVQSVIPFNLAGPMLISGHQDGHIYVWDLRKDQIVQKYQTTPYPEWVRLYKPKDHLPLLVAKSFDVIKTWSFGKEYA